ncbi:hypothetical protein CTZ27_09430 [Streptomyces griseocarneus]|nr:hypothetical protein CTZ27_09430 [Streptomyces griseocarneus]
MRKSSDIPRERRRRPAAFVGALTLILLACAQTASAVGHGGQAVVDRLILGGGLMLSGAGLGLIALVRSRQTED